MKQMLACERMKSNSFILKMPEKNQIIDKYLE